jgi:hypothetical protein
MDLKSEQLAAGGTNFQTIWFLPLLDGWVTSCGYGPSRGALVS